VAPKGIGTGLEALPSSFAFEGLGNVVASGDQGVGVMVAEFRKNVHAVEGPKRNLSGSIVRVNLYSNGGVGSNARRWRLGSLDDHAAGAVRRLQQTSSPLAAHFTVTKVLHQEVSTHDLPTRREVCY